MNTILFGSSSINKKRVLCGSAVILVTLILLFINGIHHLYDVVFGISFIYYSIRWMKIKD